MFILVAFASFSLLYSEAVTDIPVPDGALFGKVLGSGLLLMLACYYICINLIFLIAAVRIYIYGRRFR